MDNNALLQMAAQQIGGDDFGSVASTLNPDEQMQFQDILPAMLQIKNEAAKGKDARTQLYETLKNSNDELSQKRAGLIQQMAADQPLSKAETAAMLFIGLLPTLVGGAIQGKKGIAAGAQAGALGSQTMAKGFEQDIQRKRLQAQSQLESVDKQIEGNQEFSNKVALSGIEAEDKSALQDKQSATTLQAANIRAGGDRAIAGALGDQIKQARLDKLDSERQARGAPIRFGGKDYIPTKKVRDKDTDEVVSVMDQYDTIDANIKRMIAIAKNSDASFFTNQFGDSESELSKLRGEVMNALQVIKEVPGRGGQYQADALAKLIVDPTTIYNNIVTNTPAKASIPVQLEQTKKIIADGLDRKLKRRGYDNVIEIGQQKQDPKTGKIGYYIGLGENGERLYTTSQEKMLDILEGVNNGR